MPRTGRTLDRLSRPHRPLLILAAALLVLGVVAVGGLLLDDRELLDQPIWTKIAKFAVSITLYAVTLAWLLSLLPKARRWGWWLGTVVAAGLGLDMALMVIQLIGRGRRVHFNLADESDRMIHNLLATGAYTAFIATVVIAGLLSCQRLQDKSQASAVRAGLALALVGMAMATLMFTPSPEQLAAAPDGGKPAIMGAHAVGVPDGGPGLPVVGWSTGGGDLRIAHFVGLHAVQLLPLLGIGLLLLSRRYPVLRAPLVRRGLIRVVGTGYLALIVVLTWQALRGQSLVHPDAWTLLAFATIAVPTVAGSVLVLRNARRAADGAPSPAGDLSLAR